jgi:quaternary ammonium compound-resistance protein SugE
MAWTYLLIASCFEIAFALGLQYTEGFTRLGPSVLTLAAGTASFLILSQSLKTLPVGTGYAMWTGIGAVGTAILGGVALRSGVMPLAIFPGTLQPFHRYRERLQGVILDPVVKVVSVTQRFLEECNGDVIIRGVQRFAGAFQ